MRNFEEIERDLAQELQTSSDRDIDLSEGSVARAIIRSLSASQLKQEQLLNNLEKNSFLTSAESSSLDKLGYWLDRKPANRASGFIIVENLSDEIVNLKDGSTVAFQEDNLLYKVLPSNQKTRSLPPRISLPIPIEAEQSGTAYNLPSGKSLMIVDYPQLSAKVGEGVTLEGKACGPIQNGNFAETDESFRTRLLRSARRSEVTTNEEIQQRLLSRESIANVQVLTEEGGIVKVLIDNKEILSNEILEAIKEEVKNYTVSGISVLVKQANRVNISIEISVNVQTGVDPTTLNESIKAIIWDYIRSIRSNSVFNPNVLRERLIQLYPSISIINPRANIDIGNNDLVYPNRIDINYVSNL